MAIRRASTLHGQLSHGHSRLTWLLDDLEAHVTGLQSDSDARDLILEELAVFAESLTTELRHHIEEEEQEVFALVRLRVAGEEAAELSALEEEHRGLHACLDALWAAIDATRADHTPQAVGRLADTVSTLRENLHHHSGHERRFLSEIEVRLGDDHVRVPR